MKLLLLVVPVCGFVAIWLLNEDTVSAQDNGAGTASCLSYDQIDAALTIVGSGTRLRNDGETTIQVAINSQREFYIFENTSNNPRRGCYEVKLTGRDFKGRDYTLGQEPSTPSPFSREGSIQQCRDLGFAVGECIPHENIHPREGQELHQAFVGSLNSDNIITFKAYAGEGGGWSLYRTYNQGATVLAMIGNSFSWSPEVERFYADRREQAR